MTNKLKEHLLRREAMQSAKPILGKHALSCTKKCIVILRSNKGTLSLRREALRVPPFPQVPRCLHQLPHKSFHKSFPLIF
jgi:hypothetical protein